MRIKIHPAGAATSTVLTLPGALSSPEAALLDRLTFEWGPIAASEYVAAMGLWRRGLVERAGTTWRKRK